MLSQVLVSTGGALDVVWPYPVISMFSKLDENVSPYLIETPSNSEEARFSNRNVVHADAT